MKSVLNKDRFRENRLKIATLGLHNTQTRTTLKNSTHWLHQERLMGYATYAYNVLVLLSINVCSDQSLADTLTLVHKLFVLRRLTLLVAAPLCDCNG